MKSGKSMDSSSTEQKLGVLRERIDEIDQKLVKLLNERASVVVEVGKVKAQDGAVPIYVPHRERQVLNQIKSYNEGPLPDSCVEAIWRELMSGSFAIERMLRIGYLGPPGTFSHLAATRQFGTSVDYQPQFDIASVFHGVENGTLDLGLIPIENSTGGGIAETMDGFRYCDVNICAEVLIRIRHQLLSNESPENIQRVYSKPEAISQCRRWLSTNLQHAEQIGAPSTAKAAELAASEPGSAAIASRMASTTFDVPVCASNIEDEATNVTRFFVIGKQFPKPTGEDKTAIMFTTRHESGALADVLDVFRVGKISLTHLDKRPTGITNWEYVFFLECEGHRETQVLSAALDKLNQSCSQLKILGSFPRAQSVME